MNRYVLALLGAAALAACGDLGAGHGFGAVSLSPLLDSIFVGDRLVARQVTYVDPNGNIAPAGPITWSSSDTSVAQIDSVSGAITGKKRGASVIVAKAQGTSGGALVVVSDTLDITLLLDTIYMMPNDTLTVPIVVKKANPPAAAVWFTAATGTTVYSVDSASGRMTALANGGPIPYIVHADSLRDTGYVYVMTLSDTTGGKMFFSVRGTANTHVGGPAAAMNYMSRSGQQAFQLSGNFISNGRILQLVQITRPDSVIAAGVYPIDSLSPLEDPAASVAPPGTCSAPRPWAIWNAQNAILAYSRQGGTLGITQLVTVTNGQAISGHFTFTAQRADFYGDPLGLLAITGSFVAPLVPGSQGCR
jgi:hypothetical protein